jgi:ABC-type lipoprotein release transport system permease subunit
VNLLVLGTCGLWIVWLAWSNAVERRTEIGIWRACGLAAPRLAMIFLGRWIALGVLGASAGLIAVGLTFLIARLKHFPHPGLWIASLLAAVLLSGLASATAAYAASRSDPAAALRSGA